jgi:hypothetical protein
MDFTKELEFAEQVFALNGILKEKYSGAVKNPLRERDIFDLSVEAVRNKQEREHREQCTILAHQRFASDEAFKLILAELKSKPSGQQEEQGKE